MYTEQTLMQYVKLCIIAIASFFTGKYVFPCPDASYRPYASNDNIFLRDERSKNEAKTSSFDTTILSPPRHWPMSPALDSYNSPIVDHERNLLFCWIPKNSCTQIKAFFCRAAGVVPRDARGDNPNDTDANRQFIHHACLYEQVSKKLRYVHGTDSWMMKSDEVSRYAIVRDPIAKFISGYLDKCSMDEKIAAQGGVAQCFGCKAWDLECFIDACADSLKLVSRSETEAEVILEKKKFAQIDHYYPQAWLCGFQHWITKYRIYHYDDDISVLGDEIRAEFQIKGYNRSIITEGWSRENRPFLTNPVSASSPNAAKAFVRKNLENNHPILHKLLRVYWIDYASFPDLKLPHWVMQICRQYSSNCSDFVKLSSKDVYKIMKKQ